MPPTGATNTAGEYDTSDWITFENPSLPNRYRISRSGFIESYEETPLRIAKKAYCKMLRDTSEADLLKQIPFVQDYNKDDTDIVQQNWLINDNKALYLLLVVPADSKNDIFINEKLSLEEFKTMFKLGYRSIVSFNGLEKVGDDVVYTPCLNDYGINFKTSFISKNDIESRKISSGRLNIYLPEILTGLKKVKLVFQATDSGEIFDYLQVISIGDSTNWDSFTNIMDINYKAFYNRYAEFKNRFRLAHRRPKVMYKSSVGKKKGRYITHDIPFAVEIEAYGKDEGTVALTARELPPSLGVAHDGSLQSDIGYPIEFQTPILKGVRGEIYLANVCDKLVEKKFKIDKTCGLHVHFDGKELTRDWSKVFTYYLFHRVFEDFTMSLLPSTRRNNKYCADFKSTIEHSGRTHRFEDLSSSFSYIGRINTLEDFAKFWYKTESSNDIYSMVSSRYVPSRYFGVNLHCLIKDRHLEIRYHSGTLNYEKIFYWTELHGKMIEKVLDGTVTNELLQSIFSQSLTLPQLTGYMFELLGLSNDTKEYLMDRQDKFKDIEKSEEILVDKTKGLNVQ